MSIANQAVGKADPVLSVLNTERGAQICPCCGKCGIVFNVHCFKEARSPIVELCKACTIQRAGGEERVWVKESARGLIDTWITGKRKEAKKCS